MGIIFSHFLKWEKVQSITTSQPFVKISENALASVSRCRWSLLYSGNVIVLPVLNYSFNGIHLLTHQRVSFICTTMCFCSQIHHITSYTKHRLRLQTLSLGQCSWEFPHVIQITDSLLYSSRKRNNVTQNYYIVKHRKTHLFVFFINCFISSTFLAFRILNN